MIWRRRIVTTVVVTLLFGALWWNQDRGLKAVALETHASLCALKANIQLRHDNTLEYLAKHPGPEPIPGITRKDILNDLKNQKATLKALSSLSCD